MLLSDHWKVIFEFYIKWYENGYSDSILWDVRLCIIQGPINWNTLIVQSTHPKNLEENQEICFHHHCQAHLILLLWSGPDTIINTHDPMQNLGLTRIFYELGQTHLTWWPRWPDPVQPIRTYPNMNISSTHQHE